MTQEKTISDFNHLINLHSENNLDIAIILLVDEEGFTDLHICKDKWIETKYSINIPRVFEYKIIAKLRLEAHEEYLFVTVTTKFDEFKHITEKDINKSLPVIFNHDRIIIRVNDKNVSYSTHLFSTDYAPNRKELNDFILKVKQLIKETHHFLCIRELGLNK